MMPASSPETIAPSSATHLTATFTGENTSRALNVILSAAALDNVTLVDLRQSVVQKRLTLVVELTVSSSPSHEAVLYKSLLSAANDLSIRVDVDFSPSTASAQKTTQPLEASPSIPIPLTMRPSTSKQYVLTLLSPTTLTPHLITRLSKDLSCFGLVVGAVSRLSASSWRCAELHVGSTVPLSPSFVSKVRKQLFALGRECMVDIALQADGTIRRSKRLVVFDMDSTLIQHEVIDELARHAGVFDQVSSLTHEAMSGRLDFRDSLSKRLHLLNGTPVSVLNNVISNLHYTPGARTLCRTLKRLGYRLAVISAGFTAVTAHVKNELGLDYHYANELQVVDGLITGHTVGPIVTPRRKADLLMTIAQLENVSLDQVIAVGDGANDLPMLETAGVGIAFNAKPAVQEAAKFRINQPSLMTVLYLLGFTEQQQDELGDMHKSANAMSRSASVASFDSKLSVLA